MKFHAVLDIQLHAGIADPQGSTIERALPTLHLDIDATDAAAAEAQLAEVCEKFLTNPVIEGATISVVEVAPVGAN